MIRLGLRLTLGGGREAAARLVVTAIAVALGVGMLLAALACLNALNAQNGRAKWLDSGEQGTSSPSGSKSASDPLWWILTADQFGNQTIDRVDLAATGPDSPVPPGIAHLPGPGHWPRTANGGLRRLVRVLTWIEAAILTGYGLVLTASGLLVQAGVIEAVAHADRLALKWHAYLWDPWFLIWGLFVFLALWRSRSASQAP